MRAISSTDSVTVPFGIFTSPTEVTTAVALAEIVVTSQAKVERGRRVISDPKEKGAVLAREKSIELKRNTLKF